ncbi:UPF0481 protein [Quillaja saponaria]|uniref:UPF0481 protein n=1 Tax=Quillaja saponaria TaxID=32244 RepID=A0AAD7L231_QUISA|nr:UPF0481 protein [Quillaja saponaria]
MHLEDVIRDSYGGNIKFDRYELAKLMLVDGCFVLELLLRLHLQHEKSSDPVLRIPQMQIKDTTECVLRNFIAWEKVRTDKEEHDITSVDKFTSYALFLKGLICCLPDVELLHEKKIISTNVKGNRRSKEEELRTFFSRVTKGVGQVTDHCYCYGDLFNDLNEFFEKKALKNWHVILGHEGDYFAETVKLFWKHQIKILKRDRFPDTWKTIGVIAAVVLLVLTILQTYYSAK